MKACPQCGTQLDDKARFCSDCGAPQGAPRVESRAVTVQGDHSTGVGSQGAFVGHDVGGDLVTGTKTENHYHGPDPAEARRRYLIQLRRFCNVLPLAAMGADEGTDEEVTLDRVYIDLDTTARRPLTETEKKKQEEPWSSRENAKDRPVTVLEAARDFHRLVLLGDPGGGKSTFVRLMAAQLATSLLGEGPAPFEGSAGLLPVLVTLRDLTPVLQSLKPESLSGVDRQATLAQVLRDRVLADLKRLEVEDFAEGLRKTLCEGQVLLILDGLDEVPAALRRQVRECIHAALKQYHPARVMVTCRIRSYVGEAVLPAFENRTLAPFDEDKIQAFVQAWYRVQRDFGRVDALQADQKTADLTQAALASDLRELAENPMLLTTMAIIHQREIGLPRERVRLYGLAVDVLLRRWQKRKAGEDGDASPELGALLKADLKLREIVERLAYEAHRQERSGSQNGGDLERGAALRLLETPIYLGQVGLAAEFLDYVDRRAGLLVGRGGAEGQPELYSFPHRTFQEYLAGCYIVGQRDACREIWQRVGEGDAWQLAVQLGAEELIYNRKNKNELLDLAYSLRSVKPAATVPEWRAGLWSGQMAVLLGSQIIEADNCRPDCGGAYLEREIEHLVKLMGSNHLPALERADAGRVLAKLGDPRPGVGLRLDGLPDIAWVEIPAGAFLMGSDEKDDWALDSEKPQRRVELLGYWMMKYPVTQAQYGVFIATGGYAERRYWTEAGWNWKEGKGITGPNRFGEPYDLLNHPVIGVSWYEATAYCRWLTEVLSTRPECLPGALSGRRFEIRLPSETEWEKAARGTDGRIYPWGNAPDPERANYDNTKIETTSAVGCFPGGWSPYGLEETSGNVWEWCATRWESSYKNYRGDNDPEGTDSRVLRGGAFYLITRLIRCAYRNANSPYSRYGNYGFRGGVFPF